MKAHGVTTRLATRADVAAAAEVLARSFYDDPIFVWLMPDEAGRRDRLRRFFGTALRHEGLPGGNTVLAEVDGAIAGVALWLPPGRWSAPWWRQLFALPGYRRAFGPGWSDALRLVRTTGKRHPHESHWYLFAIGVAPDAQGTGIGGALLRARLDVCDEQGLPSYLESSKPDNVPIYEHVGYRAMEPLPLPDGAPPVTPMWRAKPG
jgi:GNAT superfamily N-acetyltransferase